MNKFLIHWQCLYLLILVYNVFQQPCQTNLLNNANNTKWIHLVKINHVHVSVFTHRVFGFQWHTTLRWCNYLMKNNYIALADGTDSVRFIHGWRVANHMKVKNWCLFNHLTQKAARNVSVSWSFSLLLDTNSDFLVNFLFYSSLIRYGLLVSSECGQKSIKEYLPSEDQHMSIHTGKLSTHQH